MKYFLRIIRPETGTLLTIAAPIEVSRMDEAVASYLNGYVDYHYPDFQISDFWNQDQKLMFETSTA